MYKGLGTRCFINKKVVFVNSLVDAGCWMLVAGCSAVMLCCSDAVLPFRCLVSWYLLLVSGCWLTPSSSPKGGGLGLVAVVGRIAGFLDIGFLD